MKMLNRYLDTQQDKLGTMQKRQAKLYQQQTLEQRRLDDLSGHIASLAITSQMTSTLALQNLSAVRQQIGDLCQQQDQKIFEAEQAWKMQVQACNNQARFNLGIQTVLDKKVLNERICEQRKEQKQQDELINQLHCRVQQSRNLI